MIIFYNYFHDDETGRASILNANYRDFCVNHTIHVKEDEALILEWLNSCIIIPKQTGDDEHRADWVRFDNKTEWDFFKSILDKINRSKPTDALYKYRNPMSRVKFSGITKSDHKVDLQIIYK